MRAFPFSSIISVVISPALVMAPLWAQASLPTVAPSVGQPEALQIHIQDAESLRANARTGAKQSLSFAVTDGFGAPISNAAVACRLPDSGATGNFNDGTQAAVAYTNAQGIATIDGVRWGTVAGAVAIRVTATKGTAHTGILLEMNLAETTATQTESTMSGRVEQTVVTVPLNAETQAPAALTAVPRPAVSITTINSTPAPPPGQIAKANPEDPVPTNPKAAAIDPTVSVSRTSAADAPHSSHAKWYVLAAIAVAAGAGAAFAMKGKSSSSSSTTTSSVSIGNPSISVGH